MILTDCENNGKHLHEGVTAQKNKGQEKLRL
ncbi:MAG: hypothetical protein JWO06_338 [Bacteroidota bacterium]|nr:hypothetical protein [Bacteroidota bacterium]